MFVRFRQSDRRLQASLVETHRQGGKVRHEHVAGLGSIPIAPTVADRIAFWTKLHQQLEALSNRVDAAQRDAILTAIYARIPIPTLDEQQDMQLDRAREDARFWNSLAEMHADDLEGQKGLLATAQRAIAEREPVAADTAAKAQEAKERLVRVEKGEAVAVPKPLTRKDLLRISGMTETQARHCEQVADIGNAGDDWWRLMRSEQERRSKAAEKAVVRKLHRMLALVRT